MRAILLAAACCSLSPGCTSDAGTPAVAPAATPQPQAAPEGSPFEAEGRVHLALYGPPGRAFEPAPIFDRLLAQRLPGLARIEGEGQDPQGQRVHVFTPSIDEFPPPPADSLPFVSVGLEAEQAQALLQAEEVFLCGWVLDSGPAGQAQLEQVMGLWGELAAATGGIPWDDDTREAFTVESWQEQRTAHWQQGLPRIDNHMTMHMYDNGGVIRLVSLGMDQLGLPDLTIPGIIRNDAEVMGPLINAVAQAMVEGAVIQPGGRMELDLATMRHDELREILQGYVIEGSGRAELKLTVATPQEGDADNRLWEIWFPGEGDAYHQAQISTLEGLFGASEDGVTVMEHDAELLAASERSRAELLRMKADLQGHFDQGWALLVKGPFPTPAGNTEWMWVEARSWQDGVFEGLLINEPVDIPSLKYGMTVQVTEAAFFDYRLDKLDGTVMGWHATRLQAAREGIEIE
jgi:uncharacterized protein YegJ (DUF2314 family)